MSLWKYQLNVMFCQLVKTTYPVVSGCHIALSPSCSRICPCSGKTVDVLMMQLVVLLFHLYVHLKGLLSDGCQVCIAWSLLIHCIYTFLV